MQKLRVGLILFLLTTAILTAGDIKEGVTAPLFEGKNKDGSTIKLEDYKGKVVILDFWASWCGPCQHEIPYLIDLQKKNDGKNFVILAINIDKKSALAEKFLEKLNSQANFPIIFDEKSNIPPKYELETMPTTFFIDKTGVIRYIHSGFTDSFKDSYEKELDLLLNE